MNAQPGTGTQRGRRVVAVPVTSPLDLLPRLADALAGVGPALAPSELGSAAGSAADSEPGRELGPDEDDPADPTALVVATSGSSGAPRHVLLQASALLASASATHDRLGGPGRWLLALPVHHVAGLQVLVRSLVSRTTPVVLDSSPGFTPERFAEIVRERFVSARGGFASGSRSYTALVPTQLSRIVNAGGEPLKLLAAFDAVLVGGAALAPPLLERAAAAGVRIVRTYGMTETCGGCVYDGRPLDGVSVRIESPDGDGAGRIVLSGPMLARGYQGGPATDPPQDGFAVVADGERVLRTSDLGRIDGSRIDGGRLCVLGRMDDVILTGGINVAPSRLEAELAALPSVAEVVVIGVPDDEWGERVVAAVVPADSQTVPTLEALRARALQRLGRAFAPRQLVLLDRLPLRGPGKPDRAALAVLAVAQTTELATEVATELATDPTTGRTTDERGTR